MMQETGDMMQDPRYRIINPKFQAPNPKWFGQLTILSQVEGQIQNPNDKN